MSAATSLLRGSPSSDSFLCTQDHIWTTYSAETRHQIHVGVVFFRNFKGGWIQLRCVPVTLTAVYELRQGLVDRSSVFYRLVFNYVSLCIIVGKYSLVHWLAVCCDRQQPKQQVEDSSATRISLSATPEQNHPLRPDVVYGTIEQSTLAPGIDDLYANLASTNNSEDSGAVIYSELQRRDNTWCSDAVALSSEAMFIRIV